MRGCGVGRCERSRYSASFFAVYFFYYGGYCIFSSYMVMYLTNKGYSVTLCGLITSLTLIANLITEPIGGYITDTFLSARRFLMMCVGIIGVLCLLCTWAADMPWLYFPALVATAGVAYPFSQLLDAWVNCSREVDPGLTYSRIRAGGSIGFALSSLVVGGYLKRYGWDGYFLLQAGFFLTMIPFLSDLPDIKPGNRRRDTGGPGMSPLCCIKTALREHSYCICLLVCTVYWFSHRPVGSYLSLIVEERSGGPGTYGAVCGMGAVVECLALLVVAVYQKRGKLSHIACMTGALVSGIIRPMCILLLPGVWPLYLGQLLQSVSFALFYVGSAEWFTCVSYPYIRIFSISVGLTASSVGGTIAANLLGGFLCDRLGTDVLVWLSLVISVGNIPLFFLMGHGCVRREEL